tara:strand:+ start:3575 stop:4468 length:894 start_codon:yes stop_codon:yes gene_type:complete
MSSEYRDIVERFAEGLSPQEFALFEKMTEEQRKDVMYRAGVLRDDMAQGGILSGRKGFFTGGSPRGPSEDAAHERLGIGSYGPDGDVTRDRQRRERDAVDANTTNTEVEQDEEETGFFQNVVNKIKAGAATTSIPGALSNFGINAINFNPTIDPETGNIKTSLFGDPGTATKGKLNLSNYLGDIENVNVNDFYRNAFNFDEENNYLGTDFDKLNKFTTEQGLTLKPGMDLEQNLIDNKIFGGNNRPIIEKDYVAEAAAATAALTANYDSTQLAMFNDLIAQGYSENYAASVVSSMLA